MISPLKFSATPAALATLYTVSPQQHGIIKGLTIANPAAVACNFTLTVFGVALYTLRTLGPYESFEAVSAINKIGNAGDTITILPSAAVAVLGAAIETP